MTKYISAALSDVGVSRSNNEDYVIAAPKQNFWVLADGVGGHDAGEIASELACQVIARDMTAGVGVDQAILNAHQSILTAVAQGVGKANMATTIVVLAVDQNDCRVSWVGDSRAYLVNTGFCRQVTRDHSYVQRLIDAGEITPKQAREHPYKNVVLQVLGMNNGEPIEVDSVQFSVKLGDVIVLCSDGISDVLSNDDISLLVNSEPDLDKMAAQMISQAITKGSQDNLAVQLIKNVDAHAQRAVTLKINKSETMLNYLKNMAINLMSKGK